MTGDLVEGYDDSGGLNPSPAVCRCGCGKPAKIQGYTVACYSRIRGRTSDHSHGAKLSDDTIAEIRRLHRLFWSDMAIARKLGVSTGAVRTYTGRRR